MKSKHLRIWLMAMFFSLMAYTNPAFSNIPDWFPELEDSPKLAPEVGVPGCEVYSIFGKEVDDPYLTGTKAIQIDPNVTIFDLLDACPPGGSTGPCPIDELTRFLPEVPPNDVLSQYRNMKVIGGQAVCDAGYTCGGVEIMVGRTKELKMGCVSLNTGTPTTPCEYPKVLINEVCQFDCGDLCPTGQKCSLRILGDSASCSGETHLFFCEPNANRDPDTGIVVPEGQVPLVQPPTGGPVIMPRPPCPKECPTTCKYPTNVPGLPGRGILPYCPITDPGKALPIGVCNIGGFRVKAGQANRCNVLPRVEDKDGEEMCNPNCPPGSKACTLGPESFVRVPCKCLKKRPVRKFLAGGSSGGSGSGGAKSALKLIMPGSGEEDPDCKPTFAERFGPIAQIPRTPPADGDDDGGDDGGGDNDRGSGGDGGEGGCAGGF